MKPHRFTVGTFQIQGEVISWVGLCPWTGKACAGTEDGGFGLLNHTPKPGQFNEHSRAVRATTEAVNGAAFLDGYAAVSSRHEVRVSARPVGHPERLSSRYFDFKYGSHGVVASPATNSFIAPLGSRGIAKLTPSGESMTALFVNPSNAVNFYKVARIGSVTDGELFAAACRTAGVVTFAVPAGESKVFTFTGRGFEGQDIVDVVPIRDHRFVAGFVALAASGRMFLIPGLLNAQTPSDCFQIEELRGRAYSLLLVKGHGVLLTDSELICIPNFVESLYARAIRKEKADIFAIASEASDLLSFDTESFFLIEPTNAKVLYIDALIAEGGLKAGRRRTHRPGNKTPFAASGNFKAVVTRPKAAVGKASHTSSQLNATTERVWLKESDLVTVG